MRVDLAGRSGHFSRNGFRSLHGDPVVSERHIAVLVAWRGGGGDVVEDNGGGGVVVGALSVVLATVVLLPSVGGAGRANWAMGRDDAAGALYDQFLAMGGGGGECQQGGGDQNLHST